MSFWYRLWRVIKTTLIPRWYTNRIDAKLKASIDRLDIECGFKEKPKSNTVKCVDKIVNSTADAVREVYTPKSDPRAHQAQDAIRRWGEFGYRFLQEHGRQLNDVVSVQTLHNGYVEVIFKDTGFIDQTRVLISQFEIMFTNSSGGRYYG